MNKESTPFWIFTKLDTGNTTMPFNFVHIRESLPPTFLRCVSLANGEYKHSPKSKNGKRPKCFPCQIRIIQASAPDVGSPAISKAGREPWLGERGWANPSVGLPGRGRPMLGDPRQQLGRGPHPEKRGKKPAEKPLPTSTTPAPGPVGSPDWVRPPPALQPRLTPPRRAAARPGPSRASCSADARGRAGLTRGGAWRARGRSAPSSLPRRGQRPAPRGRREDQTPTGLPPPPQLGLRQPRFPGEKKKTHTHTPPPTPP